jgi:hypothetical protein
MSPPTVRGLSPVDQDSLFVARHTDVPIQPDQEVGCHGAARLDLNRNPPRTQIDEHVDFVAVRVPPEEKGRSLSVVQEQLAKLRDHEVLEDCASQRVTCEVLGFAKSKKVTQQSGVHEVQFGALQALGYRMLSEVATIVRPDTILRWHRRLIAKKWRPQRQAERPRPVTRDEGEQTSRFALPGKRRIGATRESKVPWRIWATRLPARPWPRSSSSTELILRQNVECERSGARS